MARSALLRETDVRAVIRLVRDVCELGDDGHAWRMHMLEQLQQLVRSQVTVCYLHQLHFDPSHFAPRAYRELGTDPLWDQYILAADVNDDPNTPQIMKLLGTTFTRTREQLCSDKQWYDSVHFNEVRRPLRSDHLMVSQVPVQRIDGFSHLGFGRGLGDPPFGRREREAIHLFHTELVRLWDDPAPVNGSPSKDLPRRLRQILELLRQGLAEKQIAICLGLSAHTVHDYIKDLHRRFNAHSNGELLARARPHRSYRPALECF